MEMPRTYLAIDLKSFYASVECVERGLNPLTANLVVADESRTDKTICLAVSPSLKALGWARKGFTFKGWATSKANADAGKVWKTDGAVVKDATTEGKTLSIYAIWE